MTIEKPRVKINQQFVTGAVSEEKYLPTIVLAPRYNVKEEQLGTYSGEDPENHEYAYPNKEALSIIDTEYTKLLFKQARLLYYNSATEGSTWRKLYNSTNKIRTLLSDSLIFATDSDGLYPHSTIFNDRGVVVGDTVTIYTGSQSFNTTVSGMETDTSTSSIEGIVTNSGNQALQVGSIGAAAAGPNSGAVTAASNTGGTYAGSLYDDVIEDVITVRVTQAGTVPNNQTVANNTSSGAEVAPNSIYDYSASETYTVTIITGGALETATYTITSSSGTDNTTEQTTPAVDTYVDLSPTRGCQFKFTIAGTLVSGDTFVISCAPSLARLQITTASGKDQVLNRLFPGFAYAIPLGVGGVTLTFSPAISSNLVVGDYWTVTVKKTIDAVVGNEIGTFSGPVDTNYFMEVVQGGIWGVAIIRITSTYTDGNKLISVLGAGAGYPVTIGDYGVQVYFNSNTQGGLVKGDKFSVKANASKNTSYKIIKVKDSIPAEANTCTPSAMVYGGSNPSPTHNTAVVTGSYIPTNKALELYTTETYTIIVTTPGAYATAEFSVTSSSGLDDSTSATVISAAATPILFANQLYITFTGTDPFETTDRWTVVVTKQNLDVKISINKDSLEIGHQRVENESQTAWLSEATSVTVNSYIKVLEDTWSETEELAVDQATMYLDYRGLHTLNAESVITLSSSSIPVIEAQLGKDDIDNPAARAARFALDISAGIPIRFAYPKTNDAAGWSSLMEKLEVRNKTEVYRIAVISDSTIVINAVIAHINKMSNKNKWRKCIISRTLPSVFDVIGTSAGSDYTGTIIENPDEAGTYNILTTTNANFDVVKAGDKLVYLGTTYTISSIPTPTELELVEDFGSTQDVPSSIYVYHTPTNQELAEMAAYYGQSYSNSRVDIIAPDEFEGYNETHPGYYLPAVVAGFKASIPPHQPMTNYTLLNVDNVNKCLSVFTDDQLDVMASGGNFIITQDSVGQAPYIRHQLTTNVTDLKYREDSVTENFDALCYGILDIVEPFIGKYNLHTGVISQIRTNIEGYLFSKTESVDQQCGPQVVAYDITKLEIDPDREDGLLIEIRLYFSYPLNYIDITITV